MTTITLPSPVWTPTEDDFDEDDYEYEDPYAIPTTHPQED